MAGFLLVSFEEMRSIEVGFCFPSIMFRRIVFLVNYVEFGAIWLSFVGNYMIYFIGC